MWQTSWNGLSKRTSSHHVWGLHSAGVEAFRCRRGLYRGNIDLPTGLGGQYGGRYGQCPDVVAKGAQLAIEPQRPALVARGAICQTK